MTEWYDFSDVKSSEMLSLDSVAEAYDLIYPRLSGENFSFVDFSRYTFVREKQAPLI